MAATMLRKFARRQREKCFALQHRYYDSRGWTHAYTVYEREVLSRVSQDTAVLDIGCGRTFPFAKALLGRSVRVFGVDPVAEEAAVPAGAIVRRAMGESLPFGDGRFDLVISRCVLEHVEKPVALFSEIGRVLRPGGRFMFLTPSRFDYVSVIASVVPNALHPKIVHWTEGRAEEDTFPTYYRANSKAMIERHAREAGLGVEEIRYLHHCPTSLMFSPTLYRLATLYDKAVCSRERLAFLRGWMLGVLGKPGPDHSAS